MLRNRDRSRGGSGSDRTATSSPKLGRALAAAIIIFCSLPPLSSGAACTARPTGAGRWTLQTRDGASWLINPCGARFFSIGINTLSDGPIPPLPASGEVKPEPSISPASGGWRRRALKQMGAWGFNTAGAFSPSSLPLPSLPDLELGWRGRYLWADPFDPSVEQRMVNEARKAAAGYKANGYRIGYFSDNEIGWWNGELFSNYLKRDGANHTKQVLVDLIGRHYGGDWGRFTRDFAVSTGISSFQGLLQSADVRAQLRPGENGISVVREWTSVITRRYYQLVHRAIREADPKALIFGDRLPSFYDPDAVRAMAPFVDAIATNYNVDSPDGWIAHYYFDGLRQLTGNKPVLISEWYFAAQENRSGNLNVGRFMTVRTQAERARGAASAARNFAAVPEIVGLHWFQYYDEPKGGRAADHEDFDFGLLDVNGRPYQELVTALSAANRSLEEIHQRAAPRPLAQATARIQIPEADIDPTAVSFAQWPKDAALVKGLCAPSPEVVFGDLFLAWSPRGLHVATISMDHFDPYLLAYAGEFPRSEAFRIDFGVDAGAGARRFAFFVVPSTGASTKGGEQMQVEVCRMSHGSCEAVISTIRGRPRYRWSVSLPWQALGVSGPPADKRLRVQLAATAFYRSRWMSLDGAPPAQAMENVKTWTPAVLAGRPDASPAAD